MIDIFIPTIRTDSESLKRAIDTLKESFDSKLNPDFVKIHIITKGKSYAEAINLAYQECVDAGREPTDWFFCGADDLRFEENWIQEALHTHEKTGARVIGTNDLHNIDVVAGNHATHYLVQYGYIEDQVGTFDHSFLVLYTYKHNYTDTEFIKTARSRGEFYYSPHSVVEHMHPGFGLNTIDAGYEKSRDTMSEDKVVHDQRMGLLYRQEIPKSREILSHVAIIIPNMGNINVHLVDNIRIWTMLGAHVEMVSYFSPVDRARNLAVQRFLAMPAHLTHMLFIDSDTIPPVDAIEKMMKINEPVVTALTPIFNGIQSDRFSVYYNAFTEINSLDSKELHELGKPGTSVDGFIGTTKVDRCGMSCCLIERSVIVKIAERFSIDTNIDWSADPKPFMGPGDRLWFNFHFDVDHKVWVSEDFDFCIKAKKCGYDIFADTSIICKHAKTVII